MKPSEVKTYDQLVRQYLPRASMRDVNHVLWNMTAFPFAPVEYIRAQLATIALACAPVRKRGWHRKLDNEGLRIDAEIMATIRRHDDGQRPESAHPG